MKTSFFAICIVWFSASIAHAEALVVGVNSQAFLPQFECHNGVLSGFAGDVFALFSQTSQHQFEFKPIPGHKLTNALASGEIDIRYPDHPKWQSSFKRSKKKKIYYSNDIVRYVEGSLVIKEKANITPDKISRIGIVRGREPTAYLSLLNQRKVQAVEFSDLDELIKSTLLGKVDASYYNIDVAVRLLNIMGIGNDLVIDAELPFETDFYHLSSIKHKDIVQEFNQFLVQQKAAIDELKQKYQLLD